MANLHISMTTTVALQNFMRHYMTTTENFVGDGLIGVTGRVVGLQESLQPREAGNVLIHHLKVAHAQDSQLKQSPATHALLKVIY